MINYRRRSRLPRLMPIDQLGITAQRSDPEGENLLPAKRRRPQTVLNGRYWLAMGVASHCVWLFSSFGVDFKKNRVFMYETPSRGISNIGDNGVSFQTRKLNVIFCKYWVYRKKELKGLVFRVDNFIRCRCVIIGQNVP